MAKPATKRPPSDPVATSAVDAASIQQDIALSPSDLAEARGFARVGAREDGLEAEWKIAATARHFLDVSKDYLALRPASCAAPGRRPHSSGRRALPSAGRNSAQFQIGGEHVAR
jgi:hypothetical protein